MQQNKNKLIKILVTFKSFYPKLMDLFFSCDKFVAMQKISRFSVLSKQKQGFGPFIIFSCWSSVPLPPFVS